MLNVSQRYIETALNSSRQFKARVLIDDVEYTTDKIENIAYSSTICDGDKFVLGGGFTNTAIISILEIVEGVLEQTPVKIYVSLLVDNTYMELPLGSFFVTEVLLDRNAHKTTITVKDGMLRTEQPYNSQLTYPTNTRAIFEEIAISLQVETAPNVVLNDYAVQAKLENVTIKDMLIYLAQLSGGFVRFDRYGRLDIAKLQSNGRKIGKANYFLKGLTKNEIDFRIGGMKNTIKVGDKEKVLYAGKDVGVQVEFTNPLMSQNILDRIYDEYRRLNYFPFDIKWQGDVSLECIDWVSLEHGSGLWINVPLLSYNLNFNGGLSSTASAKASTQSQGEYAYKGAITKKIEYMEAMLAGTNPIYLDIADPQNAKNGDKWFKPNGGTVQLLEYIDGSWVKKADTADINEIVNTFTTDEVIAKKLYGAIANFIEVNASKIVAGDIDLQRLRIMDGSKEVLTVRDGKLVADFGDNVVSKSDLDSLTAEQVKLLNQQQSELLKEIEARSNLEKIRDFEKLFDEIRDSNYKQNVDVLRRILETNEAVIAVQTELGNNAQRWTTYDKNVVIDNNGMTIFNNNRNSQIQINDEGITMLSGGEVVMSIRQGMLHINRGVFVDSIQIGEIVFMVYELDKSSVAVRHIGGV